MQAPIDVNDDDCALDDQPENGPSCLQRRRRRPRGCDACLQRPGCMVDERGQCVREHVSRVVALPLTLAVRVANGTNLTPSMASGSHLATPQRWNFSSRAWRYCSTSDPICQVCIDHHFWSSHAPDSRFCIGPNGCICIANCEFSSHLQQASPADCSTSTNQTTSTPGPVTTAPILTTHNAHPDPKMLALSMLAGLLLLIVAAFLVVQRVIQRKEFEQRRQQQIAVNPCTNDRRFQALTLDGWQRHRAEIQVKSNEPPHTRSPSYVPYVTLRDGPLPPQPT